MKLLRISHLGIASPTLQEAMDRLDKIFGIQAEHIEEVADQKVRAAFFAVGETNLELLFPTSPESPIAKHLEKRGPGIHHIAWRVDDLVAAIAKLKGAGLQMIHDAPRPGSHGTKIAFVHPKATGGVLMELVEDPNWAAH